MEWFWILAAGAFVLIWLVSRAAQPKSPYQSFTGSSESEPRTPSQEVPRKHAQRRAARTTQTPAVTITVSTSPSVGNSWAIPGYRDATPGTCRTESHRRWVPPDGEVTVKGVEIPGGMIYVGSKMAGLPGSYRSVDPALINPHIAVRAGSEDSGEELSYWTSYADLSAERRYAYLQWLAGGRSDPEVNIAYVFLFFYGLERRLLFDTGAGPTALKEVPVIAAEIERLLNLYGDNHSFHNYAANLLDYIWLKFGCPSTRGLYGSSQQTSWRMSAGLKIELGELVDAKEPIPDLWALSWFLHHPATSLRTPGRRCRREFRDLFLLRYREKFGAGMRVRPPKKRLTVEYRPATPSLYANTFRAENLDLPDVESLTAPLTKLKGVAETVQDELDAYSRWVGRHEEGKSLEALALLPAALIPGRLSEDQRAILKPVESRLEDDGDARVALVPVRELIERWPTKKRGTLYKNEAKKLAAFLASVGFGMEPDPRYGGPNPGRSDSVAMYRLAAGDDEPGEPYGWATLLLHLGAAVASADEDFSEEEERLLEGHLEEALELSASERLRLRAHLRWLMSEPPDFRGIRARIKVLSEQEREAMARFLLSVAAADGKLEGRELAMLEKIYPLLGLEPGRVHSEIHSLAIRPGPAAEPVTVDRGTPAQEFQIPGPPQPSRETSPDVVRLDASRIAAIQSESRKAADLLHTIFAEEAEVEASGGATAVEGTPLKSEVAEEGGLALLRLKDSQQRFLRRLLPRETWSRIEVEAVAREEGIMAGGSIEMINERCFELWDEPLLEGGDPIEVNHYLVTEFFSEEELR